MAFLNIVEFTDIGINKPGAFSSPVPRISDKTVQNVTISGTSAQSSALQDGTTYVRIIADVAAYIEFGTNPTASSSTMYLPAGIFVDYSVPPGESYKIAGITA